MFEVGGEHCIALTICCHRQIMMLLVYMMTNLSAQLVLDGDHISLLLINVQD